MESLDSQRVQNLIQALRTNILSLWPCQSLQVNQSPVLSLDDFHAASCSPRHITEQELLPPGSGPNKILRRQIADTMPQFLKTLARNPPEDLLLICPGLVYQKGEDALQSRHELAFWRLVSHDISLSCVDDLVEVTAGILPRGMRLRTRRATRPYLVYSQGLEAYCGGWKWIGHCGLLNPMMLIECGFDPMAAHGLVLSLDLERCLAVQDKWDEICLRRRS